ncbi:MAG TPA: enoyl-CoA hydratase-related protein, partial [Hyphomicrobiaceae bacterium]|nr:enoyl-CoA hydratase-related protein [Hyphomicrobiaceae bacterium]
MSFIEISTTGPVRTVLLARPEKRNALNPAMMAEIEAAFKVMPPPEERVTVIRAQGPAFCSGLELAATGVDANET